MTCSTAGDVPRARPVVTGTFEHSGAFSRQPIAYSKLRTERLFVFAADRIREPARDGVLLVLRQPADVDAGGIDAARTEETLGDRGLDLDDHVRVVADPHELVLARDPDPRAERELVARSVLVEDDHRDALGRGHEGKPSTSSNVYRPGGLPTTQAAATSAPVAKMLREVARWAI